MKRNPKPDNMDMSYMERRDRAGGIGCLILFACVIVFAVSWVLIDLLQTSSF